MIGDLIEKRHTEECKDTQIDLSGMCTSQGTPNLVHSPEKLGEKLFRASRQSEPVPSLQLSGNKLVIFKSLSWWLFVTRIRDMTIFHKFSKNLSNIFHT